MTRLNAEEALELYDKFVDIEADVIYSKIRAAAVHGKRSITVELDFNIEETILAKLENDSYEVQKLDKDEILKNTYKIGW